VGILFVLDLCRTHAAQGFHLAIETTVSMLPPRRLGRSIGAIVLGFVAVFGCYLAARLAPRDPMRHALILGGLLERRRS
jgi:hypothetical protein